MEELREKACRLRLQVLDMICSKKGGHIGGDFSEMEILLELYCRQMNIDAARPDAPERDRFILSKGHSVEALYAVLADRGFFPAEELGGYLSFGGKLMGHPNNQVPGIEMNTGSLGHGLSLGVGMALAARLRGLASRTYVLMGDGELAEGSVWEAAMAASHYGLDSLCATVDRNGLQISGATEEVMGLEPLAERFRSFGWNAIEVPDGNDFEQLGAAYVLARNTKGRPSVVIARTVKGRGISFMEGRAKWHHGIPDESERRAAAQELATAMRDGA